MPIGEGGPGVFSLDQYSALRERAGLIDRSARGKIVVAGSDRRTYLHAMLTNDIAALGSGTGCYAAYLTPQGRMIADMWVYELGDVILLDLHPSVKDVVVERLDRFVFSEDVRIGDVTETFACFTVCGPRSAEAVRTALAPRGESEALAREELAASRRAEQLTGLAEFQNVRTHFGDESVIVAANWRFGVRGFDLYIDRAKSGALYDALAAAGAVPVNAETADVVRIEAGRPEFTVDMDAETIPLEAGIETEAISFTKGCYPGQEVVIRILHRGHGRVAKKFVGLLIKDEAVPNRGDLVSVGDQEVGRITSAAHSPSLLSAVALGYVQRDFVSPGTEVSITHGDRRLPAVVGVLPFIQPA